MLKKIKYASTFLALMCLNLFGIVPTISARDSFDPIFLSHSDNSDERPDLSVFERENSQAPGVYRVDVFINDDFVETADVNFAQQSMEKSDGANLIPCFSLKTLNAYGIRTAVLPKLKENAQGCADISGIPSATTEFNFYSQRLMLSIPQAAINPSIRGYVSPDEYDDGINAALLNYQFTGGNNYSRGGQKDTASYGLNLRPGINIGAWRLRNYSIWNKDENSSEGWDSVYTYAERNISTIKSTLTFGESSSPSDIFDSVPFRGVQLATDDQMEPESLQGYAPVVRGIAKSNAKVLIKQNGYLIYQTFVPAGAFEINDMYATGGSGDLNVTVEESDGSQQTFVVPFASLPVLRREGSLKYSLTSAEYRSYDSEVDKTPFSQATISYGLPKNTTIYGGFQGASKYQSLAFGLGNNMGTLGAISVDVTQAWSKMHDTLRASGQSWRIRYSKNFVDTGTNFSVAGYRYSTSGFNTLGDVFDSYRGSHQYIPNDRVRNRTEVNASQSLGNQLGYLNLSGVMEDYWNEQQRNTSVGVGYGNSIQNVTFNLNYSHNRSSQINGDSGRDYQSENLFSLNISVPLDKLLSNTWVNYSLNTGNPGSTSNSVGLSGLALEDRNLSWNVQETYDNSDRDSGSLGANYDGTYGGISAGYSYDSYWQRVNYGATGSVVAHANGITFGQQLSETGALVQASGVANTRVMNNSGVNTDFRGYALVPYVAAYRRSSITLDSQTLPDNADLEITSQSVVPTRGAIVRANFIGNIGSRALIHLTDASGKAIPFGAIVVYANAQTQKENSAIVGDDGLVYLSGLQESGVLRVQWGKNTARQCQANYQLPQTDGNTGVQQSQATCQ
ncbi:fimbria/pilus outer membrane usher protein [Budvicia diplopodorum]|uniref:fimbria/pilus outer membrane usher protein n=1 Tax=Budvicia diplopodorum TaxID=1119056 RepID=UPI00135A8F82|nr:fimbria/pilus outer membrane usher protein [Budvicia diplopodorum]